MTTLDTRSLVRWGLPLLLWGCRFDSNAPPPRFLDVSAPLGLSAQAAEYGPFWADLNGDGWLDLVFMNHGLPSLYFNSGAPAPWVDRIRESGIQSRDWVYPQQADRHGGACSDYDNDGDVDLFIAHGAKRGETLGIKYDELLNNRGEGVFDAVPPEHGPSNRNGRARSGAWGDYDGDGWLDLYIGNFESPNVLYRNNGDGTFKDVTDSTGMHASGPRVAWADLNEDGAPDLVTGWPLRVFRNTGGQQFEQATRKFALDSPSIFPFSMALADADNDGDLDIFIGSVEPDGAVYYNQSGVFERGASLPVQDRGAGAAWGDLDNDGDLDLVRAGSQGLRLFLNAGNRSFQALDIWQFEQPLESGGEVAMADYDGDGYLDLAFDSPTRHMLLRNQGGANSWIKLGFRGSASNRPGYGAKVWIQTRSGSASGQTLYRQYWGDSSAYNSQGCGPLHVGLGEATTLDMRVLWPSGRETVVKDVPANQTLVVPEPGS